MWWATAAVAAVVCFVTFDATGGLNLETMTTTEIVLTLLAGAIVTAAIVVAPTASRHDGFWSAGLLFALTALTALSAVWSVAPGASWDDAGRMLAYSGVFAAAIALVRLAPSRWPALLGGVTLAALVVCCYALATKVFPSLAPGNTYARLKEPFGYWNAIGLTAAMGAIGCLWLGARRAGHALLNALAYPAMGLMLLTLALAYSRGALAALAVGVAVWLCVVPLRLRGCAVLLIGGVGAAAVAAWDFSDHALSSEGVALAERVDAGHRLGALIVAMLAVLTAIGVAIVFSTGRRAPSARAHRRAGMALLALAAAAVVALAAGLAHSQRGLTGTISHDVSALTDPNARTPPNTPGRLTGVASVRARYWKEALQVFSAHPALGAGAMGYQVARLRYRRAPLVVAHAHGFVVQTLADLGVVGLAVALALLAAWMAAAGRATHPLNRAWTPWRAWLVLVGRGEGERPAWRPLRPAAARRYDPERIGLLSMLCLVITFGVHSLVDWTWYVPGNACVALLCAGWLAGRGPALPATGPQRARVPRTFAELGATRAVFGAAALAVALLAVWAQWQPQRSEDAREQAVLLVSAHPQQALAEARRAVSIDPLSPLALLTLAEVQRLAGDRPAARATLLRAVREQPSNPQTWLALGRFDLAGGAPPEAVHELQAAIYLDPESIAPELLNGPHREEEAVRIYNQYIEALRLSGVR